MEVGIHVPQVGPLANRQTVGEFAKAADEAGFDALWVFDHVVLQKNQQSKYPYSADGSLGFPPTMDFLEPLTLGRYIASPDFWGRTFQNWQSEMLAIASMAIFSIYLRERGSPESKPVGLPHDETASDE